MVLIARDLIRQSIRSLVGYEGGAQQVETYPACSGNSRKLSRKYSRKMYADTSAVKGTRLYGTTGSFLLLFTLVDLLLLLRENLLLSFLSLAEGDSDSFSGLLASPSSTRPAGSDRAGCMSWSVCADLLRLQMDGRTRQSCQTNGVCGCANSTSKRACFCGISEPVCNSK